MKKSIKVVCFTAAIISVLIGLVLLLQAVYLMFNIAGFRDSYVDLIQKMGLISNASEIDFQVNMSIFDSVIGILLNAYAAGIYFKVSKFNDIMIGCSRILLNIGILQCFFIISIIPGVAAIVLSFVLKKEESKVVNRPREASAPVDDLVDRINNLKARKESGNITEEEYNKLLNQIIEQSVVGKTNNKWLKQESLQEKIANLKTESKNENEGKDNN
jgi:uncharacterized membrane protein